jgi:hypothetical protein
MTIDPSLASDNGVPANGALARRTLIGAAAGAAAFATLAPNAAVAAGAGAFIGEESSGSPGVEPFSLPTGSCIFEPLDPARLCDTRSSPQPRTFTRLSSRLIRVPVIGRGGVRIGSRAVVLSITAINRGGPSFVTAYPSGTTRPVVANLNLGARGDIVSNLVTVPVGRDGSVLIYVDGTAELIVDLAGAYTPVTASARAGRTVLRTSSVRVVDTRLRTKIRPDGNLRVLVDKYVPADATAVLVNLTVTGSDRAGFFTAYPLGAARRPLAANVNVTGKNQVRSVAAIVKIGTAPSDGKRGFIVYSSGGANVIVDLAGYITGPDAPLSRVGMFVPRTPERIYDSRRAGQIGKLWPGWTVEFPIPSSIRSGAQGVAMNLTTSGTRASGFITVYPAGNPRPLAANLNPTKPRQQIGNHVITRTSTRGIAVYHARGGHVIADLAGYYTGAPISAPLPRPVNPEPPPVAPPYIIDIPRLGVRSFVLAGSNADAVVDAGNMWHWTGTGFVGQRSNIGIFGHRTEANALLRNQHFLRAGDKIFLKANDGRTFEYEWGYDWVTSDRPADILAGTRFWRGPTVSLISCSKRDKTPTSLSYRLITTFAFKRWFE